MSAFNPLGGRRGPVGVSGGSGPAGAIGPTGPQGEPGVADNKGGPRIQSGVVALASNGQITQIPVPYSSSMQVFVQPTSNQAGVNGFFTIATYGSLSQFYLFYSGELNYGPIEVFWTSIGE